MAYAVLGLIVGALYWFLAGQAVVSWPFWVVLLLFAGLFVWIRVKLQQRRRWALVAGRVLTVLGAVGGVGLVVRGPAGGQPVLTLLRLAQVLLAVAIAISLFMPNVNKAFEQSKGSTSP